ANSTLTVNDSLTINGLQNVAAAATQTYAGVGTISLMGGSNATNGTVVNMTAGTTLTGIGGAAGTFMLGDNNQLGSGALTLTDGTIQLANTGVTISNPITITGGATNEITFNGGPLQITSNATLTSN